MSERLTDEEVLKRFPLLNEFVKAIADADRQYAIDLINRMEIVYYDTDSDESGDIVYIATVLDNEENRHIISQLGYSDKQINNFTSYRYGEIDITNFVWKFANGFDGNKFPYEIQ